MAGTFGITGSGTERLFELDALFLLRSRALLRRVWPGSRLSAPWMLPTLPTFGFRFGSVARAVISSIMTSTSGITISTAPWRLPSSTMTGAGMTTGLPVSRNGSPLGSAPPWSARARSRASFCAATIPDPDPLPKMLNGSSSISTGTGVGWVTAWDWLTDAVVAGGGDISTGASATTGTLSTGTDGGNVGCGGTAVAGTSACRAMTLGVGVGPASWGAATVGSAATAGASPVNPSAVGSGWASESGSEVGMEVGNVGGSDGAGRAVPIGSSLSAESTADDGDRKTR